MSDQPPGGDQQAGEQPLPARPRFRLSDRTLWILLGAAALALLVAITFAWWINQAPPLTPLTVPSTPEA